MKKLLLSLLLILSLLLTACQMGDGEATGNGDAEGTTDKNPIEEGTTTSEKLEINYIRYQPVIKFYRLDSTSFDQESPSYLSTRWFTRDREPESVKELMTLLPLLQPTGETVPAIPGEAFDHSLTGPYGTIWIETEDALYRVEPSSLRICRVETYLGEGVELEAASQVKELLEDIWPTNKTYDYIGGWIDRNVFTVTTETNQETPMDVRLVELERVGDDYSLFLEVTAKKDLHVSVSWNGYLGSDAPLGGEFYELDLQTGEKQVVKLDYVVAFHDIVVSAGEAECKIHFRFDE